jgi:hypothetical protein
MNYFDLFEEEEKVKVYTFQAICDSETCLRLDKAARNAKTMSRNGVEKNVSKKHDKCPTCGHYLFWKRDEVD